MRRLAALVLLGALAAGPAAGLDDADREAVRGVISGQVEAIRRDDAAGAYAFAAPGIRRIFPSEDVFLEMVRRGYPPIYRQRRFAFGTIEETGDGLAQAVDIQDEAGVDWVAKYTLERQPDGTWRITGCSLVKAPGESA